MPRESSPIGAHWYSLGTVVEDLRKGKNMTVYALCGRAGISISCYLGTIKRSDCMMSTFARICMALDSTPADVTGVIAQRMEMYASGRYSRETGEGLDEGQELPELTIPPGWVDLRVHRANT